MGNFFVGRLSATVLQFENILINTENKSILNIYNINIIYINIEFSFDFSDNVIFNCSTVAL